MNFGDKLKSLRKEKGYTRSQLAKLLHIDRKSVKKLENGKIIVSEGIVELLGEAFGMSIEIVLALLDGV